MLENKFKTQLIKDIKKIIPEAEEFHLDPNERQGQPDLCFVCNKGWFMLEGKKSPDAVYQPNQEYYLDLFNNMSYAREIDPDNKQEVLNEIQRKFSD